MRKAIRQDRLRAAYQASGLGSLKALAAAAHVTHPTLSRIFRGRIKALNPATLGGLSQAMQVPAEWLTGERRDLPYVPEWDPWRPKGNGPSRWERPTADDVRWSWLMQRVESAVRRDLGEWYGEDARDAYDSWGRGLLAVFARLGSSMVWRSVTLEPSPKGSADTLWQCSESPSETWLEHILEPWFAGNAYLNADMLRGVFQALVADADVQLLGSKLQDDDALRALERYAAACREFFPDEARYGIPEPDEN